MSSPTVAFELEGLAGACAVGLSWQQVSEGVVRTIAWVLGGCRALMAAAKAGAKVEAPAPKAAAKTKNFGILKPLPVSPAMEKFVGASEISRTGAIQKIWEHIKLNQL
ncbi:unnamed protein product, partial [Musa textilis]